MSDSSRRLLVLPVDRDPPRLDGVDGLRFDVEVSPSPTPSTLESALDAGGVDAVLVDAGSDPDRAIELVETAREHSPGVPVVFATGDAGEAVTERALDAGVAELIRGRVDEVHPGVVAHRLRNVPVRDRDHPRCRSPVEDRGRLLDRVVDHLSDVLYVVHEERGLVAWNRTTADRLGYADARVGGMAPLDVYPEDQWVESADPESGERRRPDEPVEMDLVTADGERIPHEFNATWVDDEVTGERYRVGIAREVSDRVDYERTLRDHNDRLVEFTRSLVTDLRASLELGYAALELVQDDDERAIEDLRTALDDVEDVLDHALELAEQGRVVVEPSAVSLSTVAERAWDDLPTGTATLVVDEDLGDVECDPARLRRLLGELFENSVRHGSHGRNPADDSGEIPADAGPDPLPGTDEGVDPGDGVTVRVGRLDDGFFVADDGRGIAAAERHLVFDPGYTTADGDDGFGLGVVAEIARAHGWEVTVTEGESGGARVEVRGVTVGHADGDRSGRDR